MFVHGKTIFIRKYQWIFLKWNEGTPLPPNRWHRDNKDEDGDREEKEEGIKRGEGGEGK